MRIAIIGLGDFGIFYANMLKKHAHVTVASRDIKKAEQYAKLIGVSYDSIEGAIKNNEIIIFTVAAKHIAEVIEQYKHLYNNKFIVDFCSVKTHVVKVLKSKY